MPVRPENAASQPDVLVLLQDIIERLDRLERFQSFSVVKEAYTIEEVAERLGRAPWTVRQWCNKDQVKEAYKVHGKGRTGEWRIPHEALTRLLNEGPLPLARPTS